MSATSVRATRWPAPWLWRFLLWLSRGVIGLVARLRVSGDVPPELRGGPLILAANHVSPADPAIMTAVCARRRVPARFMATGGLFRAPVVGWVMRASGHLRVDRRTAEVANALPAAARALWDGSVVLVYPEGRIGLDPQMWPERGKTGTARLALATDTAVVPVAVWGAHEVLPYTSPRGMAASVWRAMRRRPVVRVRFGDPVDLSGLAASVPGDAVRATERIMAAIAATLAPLRPDEPELPRFVDVTRPVDVSRARPRSAPPG